MNRRSFLFSLWGVPFVPCLAAAAKATSVEYIWDYDFRSNPFAYVYRNVHGLITVDKQFVFEYDTNSPRAALFNYTFLQETERHGLRNYTRETRFELNSFGRLKNVKSVLETMKFEIDFDTRNPYKWARTYHGGFWHIQLTDTTYRRIDLDGRLSDVLERKNVFNPDWSLNYVRR